MLAVPRRVDASRVEPVVDHRCAVGLDEERLRVSVEGVLSRLGEIESAHHAQLQTVRFLECVPEEVLSFSQIGAARVERHLRGIGGSDASHIDVQDIGLETGRLSRQGHGFGDPNPALVSSSAASG